MLELFSLQVLMCGAALLLLATPFIFAKQSVFSKTYLVPALFLLLLSSLLYNITRDRAGLTAWLSYGKQHYHLLETFNELGGIEGAITSLQHHLVLDSHDAKGWFLLGKLYLAKQDMANARFALTKAHELKPEDTEIAEFYNNRP